jgi:hypothetical protein
MGFVTLAFMALSGFIAIVALLFVQPNKSQEVDEVRNQSSPFNDSLLER